MTRGYVQMLPKKYESNQPDGGAVIKAQKFSFRKALTP